MPIVTTSSRRRPRKRPTLSIAATAFVVAAAVAYFLLRPSAPVAHIPPPPGEVPASSGPHNAPAAPSTSPPSPPSAEMPDAPSLLQPLNLSTNAAGEVAVPAPTNSPGRPPKRFGKPKGAPRVNMVEQVLYMALSDDDTGGGMPPLPIDDNASLTNAFLASLTNSIVIYDTDDERTVALKERVADVKNQLRQIYEQGGSIYDALMEYQNYVNEGAKIRREVILNYRRLQSEASPEEAEAYRVEANKALEKEGIKIIGPASAGGGQRNGRTEP